MEDQKPKRSACGLETKDAYEVQGLGVGGVGQVVEEPLIAGVSSDDIRPEWGTGWLTTR